MPEIQKREMKSFQDFENYLKRVEGSRKDDEGRHYPYKDSAGYWTIGYGHRLQKEEFPTYWTEEQALKQLRKDYLKKLDSARQKIDNKFGKGTFNKLPFNRQMALTDIEFNVKKGLTKFPKFSEAIVQGDVERARRESYRYFTDETGKRKPLQDRNEVFLELIY